MLWNNQLTLRRSATPPSAIAAPNVPSGARTTEPQTRKPIFHRREVNTRMKERRGVNLPPLDAPLMATLPGPAYLFLTRNWLPKTGLR